jgi:Domain of unknown function (DUF4907)
MNPFTLFLLLQLATGQPAGFSFSLPLSGQQPATAIIQVKNKSDTILYKIIDGIDRTYGYDIFINGRKVVHQPSVPCLPGKPGFHNKEDARKVALLVIEKIRKGNMPPSVTRAELKVLRVQYE